MALLNNLIKLLVLILFFIPITEATSVSYYGISYSYVPVDLKNVTDLNYSTPTHGGNTGGEYQNEFAIGNVPSTGQNGILLDIGYEANVTNITTKTGLYDVNGGTAYIDLQYSLDGVSWTTLLTNSTTLHSEVINQSTKNVNTVIRYVRSSSWDNIANDAFRWYEIQINGSLVLYTPLQGLSQYYNYPPQTTNINFTWGAGAPAYNLRVAKDNNFNLLAVDTTVSTNYSVQALQGTQQYWWKVRTYNSTSGAYGSWSDTFNFTLQANNTANNGSVQGVVYELISGSQTAVSGASVFIYNTTWSSTQVTGSNGYYLFTNLGNGTYAIQASKEDYQSSALQTVNVSGNIVTQDILMEKCTSSYTCNYNYRNVVFRVQSFLGLNYYQYVTVNVYESGSVAIKNTGITDSRGSVAFQLVKDQLYTVTFTNASQGISKTISIYPQDFCTFGDTACLVTVLVNPTWSTIFGNGSSTVATINFSVSTKTINSTYSYIFANYTDSLNQTTGLTFVLNQTNASDPMNQTTLQTVTGGNASFVVRSVGESYIVRMTATHATLGALDQYRAVTFPGMKKSTGFDPTILLWFSIGLLLFVGGMFDEPRAKQGSLIVCGLGWVLFITMGFIGANINYNLAGGLTLATLLSILENFMEKAKQEGYS